MRKHCIDFYTPYKWHNLHKLYRSLSSTQESRLLYSQPATSDPPIATSPLSLGSLLAWLLFVVHAPPQLNDRTHKPLSNKIAHRSAHLKACGIAIREQTRGQVGSYVDQ